MMVATLAKYNNSFAELVFDRSKIDTIYTWILNQILYKTFLDT